MEHRIFFQVIIQGYSTLLRLLRITQVGLTPSAHHHPIHQIVFGGALHSLPNTREPVSPSFPSSRCSEDKGDEDTINPHVSERERSDLLSDSENELRSDDEDDLKEEALHSIRRSTEAAKLYVLKAAQE